MAERRRSTWQGEVIVGFCVFAAPTLEQVERRRQELIDALGKPRGAWYAIEHDDYGASLRFEWYESSPTGEQEAIKMEGML